MKLGCALLAAGAGKRFGGGKLLHEVDGEAMISRALRLYSQLPFDARVCVTRTDAETIQSFAREHGFAVIINPDPDRGVGTSVALATGALSNQADALDGILYAVSDQPYLTRESVIRLMQTFSQDPQRIVSLSYSGVRGNPAIFPSAMFAQLAALSEDIGGGAVIRQHADLLTLVEAGDAIELRDIDTREKNHNT